MSCQQASRFITATATTTVATTKSTAATKRIATQTLAATAAATTTAAVAKLATKTTPVVTVLDVESVGVGVAAGGKTNTPEDPYVFTETVAATPPILFNAQVKDQVKSTQVKAKLVTRKERLQSSKLD